MVAAGQSTVQRVYSRLMVVKAPIATRGLRVSDVSVATMVADGCSLYGFTGSLAFIKRVIRVRRVIEARAGDSCYAYLLVFRRGVLRL